MLSKKQRAEGEKRQERDREKGRRKKKGETQYHYIFRSVPMRKIFLIK